MKLVVDNTDSIRLTVLNNIKSCNGKECSVSYAIRNCNSLVEAALALDSLRQAGLIERREVQLPVPNRYGYTQTCVTYRYTGFRAEPRLKTV